MRKNNSRFETLKNIDLFSTSFTFYTDRKYTKLGGVLTLLSFIVGIFASISINYDDFLHKNPISTISTSKEPYRNVKFLEEKIWIPWRIRDYRSRTLNFTGLLYPIIYYYHASRNATKNALDLSFDILNYKLCNETSMANYTDSFILDIEIEKLYCIEMDNINMGGGWDTEFINYVQFDLYTCANGIDYDENNTNCSTYEDIMKAAGEDNSFAMDIYYPVVHYQPTSKKNPIFVRYDNFFYHLSRFSNKIDRIYLQKHILKDDDGWVSNQEKNISYWGLMLLSGDNYANGEGKDLMNEGSSSRLYSFNIYLYFDTIYYRRYYKKLFFIIADGLPIVTGIFSFFRFIAKIFKISSGSQKLLELLFEKRQIQHSKSLKKQNNFKNYFFSFSKKENIIDNKPKNENKTKFLNNNTIINKRNNNKLQSPILLTLNKNEQIIEKSKDLSQNNSVNILNILNTNQLYKANINEESSINNNLYIRELSNRKKRKVSNSNSQKEFQKNNCNINEFVNDNYCKKKKMFPYKYYLCTIFVHNITKNSYWFSKVFIEIYQFIGQVIDISSYLILQREFEILKDNFMNDKYRDIIENSEKINVNEKSFNDEMKKCLETKKLSILGKFRKTE